MIKEGKIAKISQKDLTFGVKMTGGEDAAAPNQTPAAYFYVSYDDIEDRLEKGAKSDSAIAGVQQREYTLTKALKFAWGDDIEVSLDRFNSLGDQKFKFVVCVPYLNKRTKKTSVTLRPVNSLGKGIKGGKEVDQVPHYNDLVE